MATLVPLTGKIKILLADDHQLIIYGISQIIQEVDEFDLCATENNGLDAMSSIEKHQPSIAILDIEMPGLSGIEILEKLEGKDNPKTIILSAYEEPSLVRKCLKLGANGYLLKRASPEEIIAAIKRVCEGGSYISQEVAQILFDQEIQPDDKADENNSNLNQLTKRELEVLSLIVDGFSNSEIAEQLFISKRTVDTHRVNLMQKLDIHNTVDLVKFALSKNI